MGYRWLRLDLGVRAVWTVFRISGSGSGKSGKTGPGHFFNVVYQMKGLGLLMNTEWSDPFFRINRIRKSGKTGPVHFLHVVSQMRGLGLLMNAGLSDPFFQINRIRKSGKTDPGHFSCSMSNERSWPPDDRWTVRSIFPDQLYPEIWKNWSFFKDTFSMWCQSDSKLSPFLLYSASFPSFKGF